MILARVDFNCTLPNSNNVAVSLTWMTMHFSQFTLDLLFPVVFFFAWFLLLSLIFPLLLLFPFFSVPSPFLASSEGCEGPEELLNGKVLDHSLASGRALGFRCDTGYDLQGEPLVVCMGNGSWSAPLPVCTRKTLVPAKQLLCSKKKCCNLVVWWVWMESERDIFSFTFTKYGTKSGS